MCQRRQAEQGHAEAQSKARLHGEVTPLPSRRPPPVNRALGPLSAPGWTLGIPRASLNRPEEGYQADWCDFAR